MKISIAQRSIQSLLLTFICGIFFGSPIALAEPSKSETPQFSKAAFTHLVAAEKLHKGILNCATRALRYEVLGLYQVLSKGLKINLDRLVFSEANFTSTLGRFGSRELLRFRRLMGSPEYLNFFFDVRHATEKYRVFSGRIQVVFSITRLGQKGEPTPHFIVKCESASISPEAMKQAEAGQAFFTLKDIFQTRFELTFDKGPVFFEKRPNLLKKDPEKEWRL